MATAAVVEGWVSTGLGYDLALHEGRLVCRNAKGRVLASVPPKVRACETAETLLGLREWLLTHEALARATVEEWMLRSLPVPLAVIMEVWPDPAWRARLENAVVTVGGRAGFLRTAVPDRGVGLVDLDGETVWVDEPTLRVNHPVLIEDLEDFRDFAAELGLTQGLVQLLREIHSKPADLDPEETKITTYSGGSYDALPQVTRRCEQHGVTVRGGNVVCGVWEHGRPVEARVWINSSYYTAEVGGLRWVDRNERPLPLGEIGPVAYSEGVRIALIVQSGARPPQGAQNG